MDAIDLLLEEAEKLQRERKAKAKKIGIPEIALEKVERITWEPEAVVAIMYATICKSCGEVHHHPGTGQLLVRYRNMRKPNEIWESATPRELVPPKLPEAIRYFTQEAEVCQSCFGNVLDEEDWQ